MRSVFKVHIAIPSDHGAWVFLFNPMFIGLFAGKSFAFPSLLLILAVLSAFLIRQPMTILVKILSGRRSRNDMPAALFWAAVYAGIGLTTCIGLVLFDKAYLFWLALPGIPVFIWHLWLVSRRAERRQAGIEIVATGALALSAPAAYWLGIGRPDPTGWWLFILAWLQAAASIVYAYLRLSQRELPAFPGNTALLHMASRALLYTSFNLIFSLTLGLAGWIPFWIFLPFLLQWLETLYGTFRPAIGYKPTRIGLRQLLISSLFTLLFILTWR